jgi:ribonuclease P protein component
MKKGKIIHSPLFSLYYLKDITLSYAAVVSKKVSKKAVIRNRNKRRVREILRKQADHLTSGAYVVFIKRDLATIKHPFLKEELLSIVTKMQ